VVSRAPVLRSSSVAVRGFVDRALADIQRWPTADHRLPARVGISWTLLASTAVFWQLVTDLPGRVDVSGASLSAVLTVLSLALAAALVLKAVAPALSTGVSWCGVVVASRGLVLVPLWGFVALAMVMLAAHPSFEGFQNVVVYCAFLLAAMATCYLSRDYPAEAFLIPIRAAGLIMSIVYLLISAFAGMGQGVLYDARTIGLGEVIVVAVSLAISESIVWPLIAMAATVVSLSRTATAAVVLLGCLAVALAIPALDHARRVVTLLAAGVLTGLTLVVALPPLRNRSLGGDAGVSVDGVHLNTSGRTALWSYTWESAMQHKWWGAGTGNAQVIVMRRFGQDHPHNDYLRMFNDLGVVGLAIFLLAFAVIGVRIWRHLGHGEPVHVAAFLALVGVAVCALTDNLIVYPYVMIPLGVLLGLSLREPATPPTLEPALPRVAAFIRASGAARD
jgi:O-antigen ligase